MVKTLEDIRRIAEIADRLRALGIPEETCTAIDKWNKEQWENLIPNGVQSPGHSETY